MIQDLESSSNSDVEMSYPEATVEDKVPVTLTTLECNEMVFGKSQHSTQNGPSEQATPVVLKERPMEECETTPEDFPTKVCRDKPQMTLFNNSHFDHDQHFFDPFGI